MINGLYCIGNFEKASVSFLSSYLPYCITTKGQHWVHVAYAIWWSFFFIIKFEFKMSGSMWWYKFEMLKWFIMVNIIIPWEGNFHFMYGQVD